MSDTQDKLRTGRLLDAWTPPEEAGDPIGCIATTFTFDPVFFEEECLGRYLQLQSDSVEDGPIYIIEREEKLAGVQVSLLVDSTNCKGDRSLRWDMLSARVPRAILHAKISLLYWRNLVRVIIASANLTKGGYRKNQEIFGIMDYYPESSTPLVCLMETLKFLNEIVGHTKETDSPAGRRCIDLIAGVRKAAKDWGWQGEYRGGNDLRIFPVMTGPERESVFDQISKLWPGYPIEESEIVSPFFDPPGKPNVPAEKLWSILRLRGPATVTYMTTAEDIQGEDDTILIHAPREIVEAQPSSRSGTQTLVRRINEQFDDKEGSFRPLHLKNMRMINDEWLGSLIGSSNFTSAGTGLSETPNVEANLFYLVHREVNRKMARELLSGCIVGDIIDDNVEVKWLQSKRESDDEAPLNASKLPDAFRQAVYRLDVEGPMVDLMISGTPPQDWTVRTTLGENDILLDSIAWDQLGNPETMTFKWLHDRPPSGFEVSWKGAAMSAWWPVNVDKSASLPPPEELKDLPLEVLINILTSARPIYQTMKRWLKTREDGSKDQERYVDPFDPHKRIQTSGFLLQKTRRVSLALRGLRERLERPVSSMDALDWRLRGPVGVQAVADAILKESRGGDESSFLLTELALEISRATPRTVPGFLPVKTVQTEIRTIVGDLLAKASHFADHATPSLKGYIKEARKEAMS